MKRNKNDAISDYMKIFSDSWTYDRMTDDERARLWDAVHRATKAGAIKGTYTQRATVLNAIYEVFLTAIGYTGPTWRDPEPETAPQF